MTKHKGSQKRKFHQPQASASKAVPTSSSRKYPGGRQPEAEDDEGSSGVDNGSGYSEEIVSLSGSEEEENEDVKGDNGSQDEIVDDDGDEEYEDAEGEDAEVGEEEDEDEDGVAVVEDDDDADFETEDEDEEAGADADDDKSDAFVTEEEEEIEEHPRHGRRDQQKAPLPKAGKATSKSSRPPKSKKSRKVKEQHRHSDATEDEADEPEEAGITVDISELLVIANVEEDDGNDSWATEGEDEEDEDYVDTRPSRAPFEDQVSVRLVDEQEEVIRRCRAKVQKIVAACRKTNRKFRDIEFDLLNDKRRAFHGLIESGDSDDENSDSGSDSDDTSDESSEMDSDEGSEDESEMEIDVDDLNIIVIDGLPGVRRVTEIYDEPKFFADAPGSNDVVQGKLGDCWFLSALAAVASAPGLIETCCVERDEQVGVYGFVFQRDGRWVDVVIDDQLFWSLPKFEQLMPDEQELYHEDPEMYHTISKKSGKGLYMSRSGRKGETWVPLIEKAYAKLHGDYKALDAGWMGDGIEDLTGGVSTTIKTSDILDTDRFWNEELALINEHKRLFAVCFYIRAPSETRVESGLVSGHAYSVLKTKEYRGKRFVIIRNPWGTFEWKGPWSDGSKEWTGEWLGLLKELNYNLGDDGAFIMEYKDFLANWETIQSTTLFDSSWVLSSHWLHVPPSPLPIHPWTFGDVFFTFTMPVRCSAYVVLSQLDTRYFEPLGGNASWNLEFAIYKRGDSDIKGVSSSGKFLDRSVCCSLDLDEGEYIVYPRLDRFDFKPSGFVEEVFPEADRRKLSRVLTQRTMARTIASNYDLDSKLHHLPQTLYEVIDADLYGDEDDDSDESDEGEGEGDSNDDEVLEYRATTTTTTQVVEEAAIPSRPPSALLGPSRNPSNLPSRSQSSMPLSPEGVKAALGIEGVPAKGTILIFDSERDMVGKPVRFGEWTEQEIAEDDARDQASDSQSDSDEEGSTEDATTVDDEMDMSAKKMMLQMMTGDDEDLKPLWLGLKVYMQFENASDVPSVTISGHVDEEACEESSDLDEDE